MAKPRTAPPNAPKTVQDGTPDDVPAVTVEKTADAPPATGDSVPEQGRGELESAASAASAADGAAVDQLQADHPASDQDAAIDAGAQSPEADSSAREAVVGGDSPNALVSDGLWLSACFEVLSPFKHNDVVVKPPAWIEMTWEEAQAYQDAGVLGDEPATPEELE
ncbi:hypothetical protein I5U90_08045 [Stenotrophomonas maltophilia]|nr:hypothetical protein [Stenotrophomonas maltophilia]